QTSSQGATQQFSSGNTSSLAVPKYSSSGIFITGSGNDLRVGIEGPSKATPLRVVIAFISPFSLAIVLLRKVPEVED
nr:hypothetical protein [Tanacetum cinerariifolium]